MKLYRPTVSVLPVALSSRNEYSAVALHAQISQLSPGLVPLAVDAYPFEILR